MKDLQYVDPVFKQLFAKIPCEITDTFTQEQIEAIKKTFGSRSWNRHPLDLRFSVPFLGLRFYLVLLAGSEQRSKQRLQSERSLHPLWTPENMIFLTGFFLILLTSSFTTLSFVFSLLTSVPTSPYPTSIPWLHNKSECQHTSRTWRDGKCWDYEHNPMF